MKSLWPQEHEAGTLNSGSRAPGLELGAPTSMVSLGGESASLGVFKGTRVSLLWGDAQGHACGARDGAQDLTRGNHVLNDTGFSPGLGNDST